MISRLTGLRLCDRSTSWFVKVVFQTAKGTDLSSSFVLHALWSPRGTSWWDQPTSDFGWTVQFDKEEEEVGAFLLQCQKRFAIHFPASKVPDSMKSVTLCWVVLPYHSDRIIKRGLAMSLKCEIRLNVMIENFSWVWKSHPTIHYPQWIEYLERK